MRLFCRGLRQIFQPRRLRDFTMSALFYYTSVSPPPYACCCSAPPRSVVDMRYRRPLKIPPWPDAAALDHAREATRVESLYRDAARSSINAYRTRYLPSALYRSLFDAAR